MTRDEAEARAKELRTEQPEDGWVARPKDGEWAVVRLKGLGRGPAIETIEAKPKPPTADDPRPVHDQNVGGPYAV